MRDQLQGLTSLLSAIQRDLRGFYRATTSMYGGLILAAVRAASHDNFAAALLVTVAGGWCSAASVS